MSMLRQGHSQDLDTECPKLSIVNVFFFFGGGGGSNFSSGTTIYLDFNHENV